MKKHTCKTPRLSASLPSASRLTAPATTRRCAGKHTRKVRRVVRRAALKNSGRTSRESPTVVAGTVAAGRLQGLWDQPIEYMYHKSFDKPGMEAVILGPAPEVAAQRLTKAPSGLPAYLASLYEVPLLTREQEAHYFRKLNYLKHQAEQLRKRLDGSRASRLQVARLEKLMQQAAETKNLLIRANLRLVVSVVRNHIRSDADFSELISDGNMSLMRAIDRFDFSRGFKFSTYAVWAIRNNFSRSICNEHVHRERFRTGAEEVLHGWSDRRSDEYKEELAHEQRRETVRKILRALSDREQNILVSRFGLQQGSEPQTLEEVGAQQGVTKERIRQLEKRALNKLRELAIADDAA